MTVLLESPGDADRRAGLRQMRIVATSLLVVAVLIYLLTLGQEPKSVLGFVNTAAEAAMVGALADWFAVTALFRHPLGIPIPHTALVQRRKDDLGRSLQQFVTANFLTGEIFRERVAQAQLGRRLASWLDDPRHRHRVLTEAIRIGRMLFGRLKGEDITGLIEDTVIPRLRREPLSPIAGAFLEGILADKAHKGLIDLACTELHRWLIRHPEKIAAVIGERAPGWAPDWMDRVVSDWGYRQAVDWARHVRDNSEHPARLALDDVLTTLARDLQHDPDVRKRGEALKERLLDHPQIGTTVLSLWQSVRDSLLGAMDDETSSLWTRGDGWLREFGERLTTDDAMRGKLEDRFGDIVDFLVSTYGEELATVISHTVERWDATEASNRIELFVGRDLQFIRINGTIVGALAGLAIHTVSVLLT